MCDNLKLLKFNYLFLPLRKNVPHADLMYDNVALVRAKGYTYFATPYNKLRSTRIPTQFAGSYEGNDKGHTGIIAFAISLSQIQLKLDNPHRHIDDPKWIFEVMYAFKTVFLRVSREKKS